MQQRDYLHDQIEQFGKVLRQLIAGMLGRSMPASLQNEAADQLLNAQNGIRLQDIPNMQPRELEQLVVSPLLQGSNAETLAEMLIVFAEQNHGHEPEKAQRAASAAAHVLQLTDRREKTVSLHRMALLERSDPKHFS